VFTGSGISKSLATAEAATLSDGAVVGSAVVDIIADGIASESPDHDAIVQKIAAFVGDLATGIAASKKD